ncbi:MAG: GNAT family N-acetyltransferase [Nocardioidaceae bacterium]|nr:GNAT family N-acetyltransferase [Nocardioidaceae bacterium]
MRFPDDVPTLGSRDVVLRAHRPEDADAVVEQCVDPVSLRWTTVPRPYSRAMAEEFIGKSVPQGWESGKEFAFALECTHPSGERRFGGTLSLRDEGARRAEIAFGAHPAIRGRGVMTTAVNLLLDWGFHAGGVETVLWLANEGNFGSRRVAWKTGFTFGGTVRRWLDHRGEYPDGWVGALHRNDPREPTTDWLVPPHMAGQRVALRPMRDSDVPRIAQGCADPRTQHWLAFLASPYADQDGRDYLGRTRLAQAEGSQLQWAVADPDSDEMLGNVGIPRMHRSNAEIGYWTHPDARGRGVMTEAVSLAVRHAFAARADGGLGLRRLFIRAAQGNDASHQIARANGFTEQGRERRAELLGDGTYADMVLFDLLRDEWKADRR